MSAFCVRERVCPCVNGKLVCDLWAFVPFLPSSSPFLTSAHLQTVTSLQFHGRTIDGEHTICASGMYIIHCCHSVLLRHNALAAWRARRRTLLWWLLLFIQFTAYHNFSHKNRRKNINEFIILRRSTHTRTHCSYTAHSPCAYSTRYQREWVWKPHRMPSSPAVSSRERTLLIPLATRQLVAHFHCARSIWIERTSTTTAIDSSSRSRQRTAQHVAAAVCVSDCCF